MKRCAFGGGTSRARYGAEPRERRLRVGWWIGRIGGEARFTRDIDVAVAVVIDEQAERVVWELQGRGYGVLATVEQDATHRLATVRLSDPAATVCDLVFATCGIEAEVVETAEQLEVFPTNGAA